MIKLNLGCWKRNFGSDWIHIDQCKLPHINSNDIVNLPFDDDSVDLIYCSHTFEYFDRLEGENVLKKWLCKLKPNGRLRLAVPDFFALKEVYDITGDLSMILGPLYGKMDIDGNKIYHKTVYDFPSLCNLLHKVGFRDIKKWNWRETEHMQFNDHSQAHMLPDRDRENGKLISLNVECSK